ncbi:MAG: sulfite exporter TauE/SafE family protein [Armatimonadota bacterium]|nr:sulfite exporter TauE/SafE family protein [bacterium]
MKVQSFLYKQRVLLILIGTGLVAGLLGGLLGIGGGALVVPVLVFFLDFKQHRAHGTSLVAALLLGVSAVITYALHGHVDIWLALEIAAGGVIGAMIGGRVVKSIKGSTLQKSFSVFLILVAVQMIFVKGHIGSAASMFTDGGWPAALTVLGTGVITGFMSALLGIGGGMVMIPAMVILLGVPQKAAQGVSLAAAIPTAFTAMLMHKSMGNVDLTVGATVGAGAIFGAVAGASIAALAPEHVLKISFSIFLLVIAVLLALKKQ